MLPLKCDLYIILASVVHFFILMLPFPIFLFVDILFSLFQILVISYAVKEFVCCLFNW